VGLAARRRERLEALAQEIGGGGGAACVCPCDVAERGQVLEAVERTVGRLGPVELLVANAGLSESAEAGTVDGVAVARLLRVNFLGAVYAAEAVLPSMVERGRGHLVAMGSLAGYGGLPRSAAYSASKGALHNYFESLRLDLRGSGVAVTIVTPGYVRTELTDRNRHPMPRLLELDDALDRIMRAIRSRKSVCSFPRPLSTLAWLGQILPAWLYDTLGSRVRRGREGQLRAGREADGPRDPP